MKPSFLPLTSVRPGSPTISRLYLQRGSQLYFERGSDPHLIGGTGKSCGRAIVDVLMIADIVR
jgi:hypothetical protein